MPAWMSGWIIPLTRLHQPRHSASPDKESVFCRIPALLVGENIAVFQAGTGLGHHGGYTIAPLDIVRRVLVMARGFDGPIDLDQNEAGRIVLLLNHIETGDAGFMHTLTRIFQGGGLESLDLIRFDMDKYMNDEHGS